MTSMPLGLFLKNWQSKVCLAGNDKLFAYFVFVVEAKSKTNVILGIKASLLFFLYQKNSRRECQMKQILGYFYSNPMFPLSLQLPSYMNTFQTIILRNICLSAILKFCLWSVVCCLLSMVCSMSAAYTSLCRGLKYIFFEFRDSLFGQGKNIVLCLKIISKK